MDQKVKFCHDNCRFLSITEDDQDKMGRQKPPHLCLLYKCRLLYDIYHPKLIRYHECDVDMWNIKEKEKEDFKSKISSMSHDKFEKEYCVKFTDDDKIDPSKSIELLTKNDDIIYGVDLADPDSKDCSIIFPFKV